MPLSPNDFFAFEADRILTTREHLGYFKSFAGRKSQRLALRFSNML